MPELDYYQKTKPPRNEPITANFLAKMKWLILNSLVGGDGITVQRSGERVIVSANRAGNGLGAMSGGVKMYTATTKAGLPSGVSETSMGRVTAGADQGVVYIRDSGNSGWVALNKLE